MAAVGFQDETLREVEQLFARYPKRVHALLPVLHLAQRENHGWLPSGWDRYIAQLCGVTLNHVRGVITFYNMFKTRPVGRNHILVCNCLPCGLCGGQNLLEHLEHRLRITPGNTTQDQLFSLEEAQCLAACDKAPLMLVNGTLHEKLSMEAVDAWIRRVRNQAQDPQSAETESKSLD